MRSMELPRSAPALAREAAVSLAAGVAVTVGSSIPFATPEPDPAEGALGQGRIATVHLDAPEAAPYNSGRFGRA